MYDLYSQPMLAKSSVLHYGSEAIDICDLIKLNNQDEVILVNLQGAVLLLLIAPCGWKTTWHFSCYMISVSWIWLSLSCRRVSPAEVDPLMISRVEHQSDTGGMDADHITSPPALLTLAGTLFNWSTGHWVNTGAKQRPESGMIYR